MQIGIIGVSGLIGQKIAALASLHGHGVVGFSRQPKRSLPHCDSLRLFDLQQPVDLSGLDTIIHLAGESIIGLWTAKKKARILASRRETTRALVASMEKMAEKPAVFLCSSGTAFYGDRDDSILDENAIPGSGFLAEVAKVWEEEAAAAKKFGVRVCSLRTAMVLSEKGGAFPLLRRLFQLGLGGKLGSGRQYMPWLHLDDIAALYLFCAETPTMHGPVNASAPDPITNAEFTRALAKTLHRPAILPAPTFALRTILQEQATLLLDSQRVIPAKAQACGFSFAHADLHLALQDLTGKK